MEKTAFPDPDQIQNLETGRAFAPRFDANGLITCVVSDYHTGAVVMVAHMNRQALAQTLQTRIATYWSRSRQKLWVKGETSGSFQSVQFIRTDCDQDALWLSVITKGTGATCHTGRHSCFYRAVDMEANPTILHMLDDQPPLFDPDKTYSGQ